MSPGEGLRVQMVGRETAEPGKYLTFSAGGTLFGLPVARVVHVLGRVGATPLPGAPPHVLGMIEFRRHALPLLDLAGKLGGTSAAPGKNAIVAAARLEGEVVGVALSVDTVYTVIDFGAGAIQDPPVLAECHAPVLGVARSDRGGVAVLLDLDRLLAGWSTADWNALAVAATPPFDTSTAHASAHAAQPTLASAYEEIESL
ncbi:chemotaxis protein CheW [bacterium]|nr:chemotaxis protein CheW [bacterium]